MPGKDDELFNSDDQEKLCINEHERFVTSSGKVAHALVYTDGDVTYAKQFAAPSDKALSGVKIRPVEDLRIDLEKYGPYSKQLIRATTPNGTEMVGKRKVKVHTTDPDGSKQYHELWRLSPVDSHMWKGKLFVGAGPEKLPIFTDKLDPDTLEELRAEQASIEPEVKHMSWTVEPASVQEQERREKAKIPRNPDQNTVMARSAFDEFELFHDQYATELDPERKAILAKNREAKALYRGGSIKSQYRAEWLHLKGYVLSPLSHNPQVPANLAAGPKWLNSQMMTDGERTAKWIALRRPGVAIEAECKFTLCPGSEIIDHGHMRFSFDQDGQKVVLAQDLNPWIKYPDLPKATDIAQTTLVASELLAQREPASIQTVQTSTGVKPMPKPNPIVETKTEKTDSIEQYKSSIVRVFTSAFVRNYGKPWHPPTTVDCTGSGVVIRENGQLYILTNAHVVDNHADVRVRLANDNDEYLAKVINVGYQCDMAIMQVDAPEFNKKAKPLPLGEMLKVGQNVQVLGFPMGGEEMSYTVGPVSRILFGSYSESGESNLQVQTQAPMNPGNSGGPVLHKGKVVGLAFQIQLLADGLNYVIPEPVMRHFLTDTFNPTGYKGFPDIGMDLQELTNPWARAYYGLRADQTGIRVKRVDPLEDAAKYLKVDDVITAVDGFKVSNDARIDIPGVGERLDINYAWLRKHVGDQVVIEILRKNPQNESLVRLSFAVKLNFKAGMTKKVGPHEYDKSPSYYINSGVVFQPLTPNYLEESEGLIFRELRDDDDSRIADIPAKNVGDQFVIINRVFKCNETVGFHEMSNQIVKTVNGLDINNLQDVVRAMENNAGKLHSIVLKDFEIVVIPVMSPERNNEILEKYGVARDRSIDVAVQRQSAQQQKIKRLPIVDLGIRTPSPQLPGFESDSCHSDEFSHVSDEDLAETLSDFLAPEDETGVQDETEVQRGFTGRLTFMNKVQDLERKYKHQRAPAQEPAEHNKHKPKRVRMVVESDSGEEEMPSFPVPSSRI